MKIIEKKVYYCDFCKKHGLAAGHMSRHEKRCTKNPVRDCGMCDRMGGAPDDVILAVRKAKAILESHENEGGGFNGEYCGEFQDKINKIKKEVDCPACMFSVLRFALEDNFWPLNYNFNDEVTDYWKKQHEEEIINEMYSL